MTEKINAVWSGLANVVVVLAVSVPLLGTSLARNLLAGAPGFRLTDQQDSRV